MIQAATPVYEITVTETRVLNLKRVITVLGSVPADAIVQAQRRMDFSIEALDAVGRRRFTEWNLSPSIETPAERIATAFKLAPELKAMIDRLIWNMDDERDVIQPTIDTANEIINTLAPTFEAREAYRDALVQARVG